MSNDAESQALRSALAMFAARPDLTPDARRQLAVILAGHIEGFGVLPSGELALASAALSKMLGVSTATLVNWRREGRKVGPPCVEINHGKQRLIFYPVAGVQEWLSNLSFSGSYQPDPSVLAAFGLSPVEEDRVAA